MRRGNLWNPLSPRVESPGFSNERKISLLLTMALIFVFLTLSAAIFRRFNVPLIILALALGIIFGSDVTGIIYFDDALLARRFADIALVFVLFAGGFSIKRSDLKPVFAPTMTLATIGVLLTTLVTAIVFHLVSGWTFQRSLLVSTVISSTDAAAVFSILRNRSLQKRASSITEIESAANDPMAIISTTLIVQLSMGSDINTFKAVLLLLWQLAGGLGLGLALGWIGLRLLRRIRDVETGYFYILLSRLITWSDFRVIRIMVEPPTTSTPPPGIPPGPKAPPDPILPVGGWSSFP